MLAVLLALASAVGYGSSDYAGGLAARQASVIRVTILAHGVSAALMILVLPLAGLRVPALGALAWGAAAGLGEGVGAVALFAGFRDAEFSVAGPVSAIGSAGFSALAGLLLGERPGTLAMIGIGLARPAIIGVSASPGSAGPDRPEPGRASPAGSGHAGSGHLAAGITWGLLAGAAFAVLFIALNRAGAGSGLWPVVSSQVSALVTVVCLGVATGEARLPTRRAAGPAALTGVTGAAGEVQFRNRKRNAAAASITAAVAACTP